MEERFFGRIKSFFPFIFKNSLKGSGNKTPFYLFLLFSSLGGKNFLSIHWKEEVS
jgi:hypothetical protein